MSSEGKDDVPVVVVNDGSVSANGSPDDEVRGGDSADEGDGSEAGPSSESPELAPAMQQIKIDKDEKKTDDKGENPQQKKKDVREKKKKKHHGARFFSLTVIVIFAILLLALAMDARYLMGGILQQSHEGSDGYKRIMASFGISNIILIALSSILWLTRESHQPKPSGYLRAKILVIISGILEGIGWSGFLGWVLPDEPVGAALALMEGMCVCPAAAQAFEGIVSMGHIGRNSAFFTSASIIFGIAACLGQVVGLLVISPKAQTLIFATLASVSYMGNYLPIVSSPFRRNRTQDQLKLYGAFRDRRFALNMLRCLVRLVTLCVANTYIGPITHGEMTSTDLMWAPFTGVVSFEVPSMLLINALIYVVGWGAISITWQRIGFSIPLILAGPLSVLYMIYECNNGVTEMALMFSYVSPPYCEDSSGTILLGLAILVGSEIVLTRQIWKSKKKPLQIEQDLWYSPLLPFNMDRAMVITRRRMPVFYEDVNRTNKLSFAEVDEGMLKNDTYTATTMWHEEDFEMKANLEALKKLAAKHTPEAPKGQFYEFHICLDDAFRDPDRPGTFCPKGNKFADQLKSLIKEVFEIPENEMPTVKGGTDARMDYGRRWHFYLHVEGASEPPEMFVHLKDVALCKGKKRFSQLLLVHSINLRHQLRVANIPKNHVKETEDSIYVLMTDGDTGFDALDVENIRRMLVTDKVRIGGACGRIYPIGMGPMQWYQSFEYAAGHWLQKTAETVWGSVLCCPGCFSMFSLRALMTVVEQYSGVSQGALESLMMDQGEDRWMCTLLMKRGYMLTYCAISKATTFCPNSFSVFFNQRRRWITSSVANVYDLLRDAKTVVKNRGISYLFYVFVVYTLISTLIGPGTSILVLAGGLQYGVNWNVVNAYILILSVTGAYALLCMWTGKEKKDLHIKVAMVLTVFFMVLSTTVIVGMALQMASEPGSVDAIAIMSFILLYVICGLMHLKDALILPIGFLYFLLMPTMYLILIIFAFCNVHDMTWGTRESKLAKKEDLDIRPGEAARSKSRFGVWLSNTFYGIGMGNELSPAAAQREYNKKMLEKIKNICANIQQRKENLETREKQLRVDMHYEKRWKSRLHDMYPSGVPLDWQPPNQDILEFDAERQMWDSVKHRIGETDPEIIVERREVLEADDEKLKNMVRATIETAKNRGQTTGLEEMPHYIRETATLAPEGLSPGTGIVPRVPGITPHSTKSYVSMGANGPTVITEEELAVVEVSLAADVEKEHEKKRLKEDADAKVKEIMDFRQNICYGMLAINLTWVALFMSLSFHEDLQLFEANSLGIVLFIITGLILFFQFSALVVNRSTEFMLWIYDQWKK